jgi:Domain of unknown function (DUF1707)
VNTMTGNYHPGEMKASDSDRDAVVSELSEQFQAGRLTAGEFDERMARALAARTWGELSDLLADLPASGSAPQASSGHGGPPLIAVLAGIGITAAVLIDVADGRWGFLWLLLPLLFVARRLKGGRDTFPSLPWNNR